ncbi:MAG: NAD(P)H-dependent oxidoreductase [Oscillospiraceae bacterium]|nr:NAD(P)H-dependent oxidoreductase [Oscillospiraceae bacterium]
MKKVLFIVGSLRKNSFNRQLAQTAAASFTEVEYSFLEYSDLPYMNQDIEYPVPEAVRRVRDEVSTADVLWIFTPEYNFSYPGVLKNLLDWLSRPVDPKDRKSPSVIKGKPVMFSSVAGQSAGMNAQGKLAQLLHDIGAVAVKDTGFGHALGREEFMTDQLQLTEEEKMQLAMEANAMILSLNGF